jgi:hypothetical protein
MLDDLLGALAASPPATALRASRVVYPVVNALHILGLAALFGAILALDLRLLGVARSIPAQPLARYLPRVAAAGLGAAVLSGLVLFTVQPADYIGNRAFLLKVALVGIGALHAVSVHRSGAWRRFAAGGGAVVKRLRLSAALSLATWVAAILAGRFIAF